MNTTAPATAASLPRRRARRSRAAAAMIATTALLGGLAAAPAASAAPVTPVLMAPVAAADPVESAELVARWYEDFLGRAFNEATEDPGLGYWTRRLDAGESREAVLSDLVRTPEFARNAVKDVYLRTLKRLPDPGAGYWTENVPRGMAVEWVEQNALSADSEANPIAADPGAWVNTVYPRVLGRPTRPGEPTYWAGRFAGLGALGVVREIWYSPEGVAGRVADSYAELLGRSASPGEIDYWRAAEARSDLAVRVAIASSGEYAEPFTEADAGTRFRASFVEDFLTEVAAGQWRAAFDRLSPQSQEAVGGYAGFVRDGGTAWRLVLFSDVPRRDYTALTVYDSPAVVVVAGEVPADGLPTADTGRTAFDSASFGVRPSLDGSGGQVIDVAARPVGLTLGPASRTLDVGEPFTLSVDRRGLEADVGTLVDGEYQGPGFPESGTGTRFSITPDPALAPGRHVVTAFTQAGDVVQVESATFTVR